MKNKDLKEILDNIDDDADIVFAKAFVVDKEQEITAIIDCPVIGIATNDEDEKELRFVLSSEDAIQCFGDDMVLFKLKEKNNEDT